MTDVASGVDGRATRKRHRDLEAAQAAAKGVLELLAGMDAAHVTVAQWQRGLGEVGLRLAALRAATADVSNGFGLASGQARLLNYLRLNIGVVVQGDELAGVAGISDWPRRVRELRTDHGWPIETGTQRPDLRSDEYLLIRDEQDEQLLSNWRRARELREQGGPIKARLLEYLIGLSPQAADQDQLRHVAGSNDVQRHLGDLMNDGWDIHSHQEDSTLAPGSYRLVRLTRRV